MRRKVAPSKAPLAREGSGIRAKLADAKVRLSPLGSKRRLNVVDTAAASPNALDAAPLGSPGTTAKTLAPDALARSELARDGSGTPGGPAAALDGGATRTDVNSSSGDSSSEGQQLAALQDLLSRGDITPDQFRSAVVAIAVDHSDESKSSDMHSSMMSDTDEWQGDGARPHAVGGMSAAKRFDISRPWLLKSFIMPDEKRNIDAVLRATGTDDAYQALRYIRAHPTVAAAVAALQESLHWRKEIMEPLLQNPSAIIDELMTERIWLLPRASRENNPIIFFNSARAKNVPDDAQIRIMVLCTLYVMEKALKCCEDPMAQVEFVMNRSKEHSEQLPEDEGNLTKAELKLYRIRFRQRLRLLMTLVNKHYPGRIRVTWMAGVDMSRPVVLLTVSFMQQVIAKYNFPVEAVSIAQLLDKVGSQNVPKAIGGDLSYSFVLSDVMMPSLHVPFYSKSALRLRFDDTELEREYRRVTHHHNRGLRAAMSIAAAITVMIVVGYAPDTDAGAACGVSVSGAAWYYIAAWAALVTFGLFIRRCLVTFSAVKRATTCFAIAFAILVQSPSIHRAIQGAGWDADDPCHALRATTGRPVETGLFGAALYMIPATLQLQPRPNLYALLAAWVTWIIPTCVEANKGVPTNWTLHVLGLVPIFIIAAGLGLHDALARTRYRKQIGSEQSLRAVQAELSSLRSQTRNAPVLALDTNLRVIIWSPSMQSITGWRSARAVGQPFVNFVAPADRKRVGERLAVALKQNASASLMIEVPMTTFSSRSQKSSSSSASSASQGSNSMLTAEAENVTLLCNVAQRSDTNARVSGLTLLAQDISERVRLETARKRFIASFSHELRTPLSGIMGMLDLLDLQPVGGPAHKLIHKAQISSNLLLNLVNDILDMSRIEAGNMELENRPFSVQRVVAHSLDLVRYQAEMKKLNISHEIDSGVPEEVSGDVTRFRQVLLNLLSNAVKFTMQGEVRVSVSADFVEKGGGVKLRVSVRDSGVGISESNLPRLFHMFSKVGMDNDMVNNASGCGLGLAISSRLVHLMGGEVSVSSKFGRGSTFTFTVLKRFVDMSSASASGSAKGSVGSGTSDAKQKRERVNAAVRGLRVLLAEDNAFNAEIITSHLESAGVVVHWASNGRNALDEFKQSHSDGRPYQAVIMDCQMPVMTGWDATKVIREWETEQERDATDGTVADTNAETTPASNDGDAVANVPIIALTAYASETEKTKCLDSGMNVVITKPVQRSLLLRCLASFFDSAVSDTASNASSKHREYADEQIPIDEDAAEQHDSYGHRSNPNALTASLTASMLQRETQDRSSAHTSSSGNLHSGSRGSSDKGSRSQLGALSIPLSTGSTVASGVDLTRDSWGGAAAGMALSASCHPIDEALGMSQFGSSKGVYYKMMSKFATEYLPTGYSAICAAAKANDNIALRMEAHSLKGAAAFVGASALSDTCERLMSVCGLEGEVAPWQQRFITQLVSQLQAEYELLNVYFESKHNYTLVPSESLGTDSVGEVVGLFAQDKAKCQGCHALFAEDNQFTVEVLKCLVANVGMTAKWVTDGSQVVQEYTKAPSTFQLIIMDCQMPKQSGPEAARQIREWEENQDTTPKMHIPIVGLSAYELHRKECVDAGMDRFVVKPIGRAALIHLIAECVKHPNMALLPSDSVTLRPGEVPGSRVLFSPVDEGRARDLFDSPGDFASKLKLFVDTEICRADRIADMLKSADWKHLHLEAHALKGSAASVCASGLAQACSRLQDVTHDDGTLHHNASADTVANLVSSLKTEVDQLHAYQRRQSKNAATSDTAAGVAARDATGASDADATELSPPPASAGVAAKADPAPPASKALRLYTARDMVAWAREVLQMPEHVCNALHEANVDGEDVCSFSNEEWDMLTKEHGLSGLVVRKLRRKCTLAAEAQGEQAVDDV